MLTYKLIFNNTPVYLLWIDSVLGFLFSTILPNGWCWNVGACIEYPFQVNRFVLIGVFFYWCSVNVKIDSHIRHQVEAQNQGTHSPYSSNKEEDFSIHKVIKCRIHYDSNTILGLVSGRKDTQLSSVATHLKLLKEKNRRNRPTMQSEHWTLSTWWDFTILRKLSFKR